MSWFACKMFGMAIPMTINWHWLLLTLFGAHTAGADKALRNAVLVAWDGANRTAIRELLDAGKLPVAADLACEGALQDITITSRKTSTMPGHATMLTGYLSGRHQVFNNDVVKPIPDGWTIFERLEQQRETNAIVSIMIAGKSHKLGGATTNDVFGLSRQAMDHFESEDQPAAEVVHRAPPVPAQVKHALFILFLHFPDVDRAGHGHGMDSNQYRDAFIESNRQLGWVIEALKTAHFHASTSRTSRSRSCRGRD